MFVIVNLYRGNIIDIPAERLSGEAGREPSSAGYPSRRRRGRGDSVPGGAGRYGGVTVPALPVRFVAGSAGGFADVAIGRRIVFAK